MKPEMQQAICACLKGLGLERFGLVLNLGGAFSIIDPKRLEALGVPRDVARTYAAWDISCDRVDEMVIDLEHRQVLFTHCSMTGLRMLDLMEIWSKAVGHSIPHHLPTAERYAACVKAIMIHLQESALLESAIAIGKDLGYDTGSDDQASAEGNNTDHRAGCSQGECVMDCPIHQGNLPEDVDQDQTSPTRLGGPPDEKPGEHPLAYWNDPDPADFKFPHCPHCKKVKGLEPCKNINTCKDTTNTCLGWGEYCCRCGRDHIMEQADG